MTSRISFVDSAVHAYLTAHTTPPSPVEQRLIDETQAMSNAGMQIGVSQGQFMATLTRLLRSATAVEIGVFTGYSGLKVAQELPPGGRLIACDVSEEWTSIAQRYWKEAGVADRIDLIVAPALETLAELPDDLIVDMAFIDADKTEYLDYLEALVPHMSGTSIVLVDNVLWDGRVADESDVRESTLALRRFNDAVVADPRFEVALLPVGDGVSMITLSR